MTIDGSILSTSHALSLGGMPMSSARGELPFQLRKDLICVPRVIAGRPHFVIKDPVRMVYFYYLEEDFYLLESLGSAASFAEIRTSFESKFGTTLSDVRVKHLVSAALRDRIGFVRIPGQGADLYRQQKKHSAARIASVLKNPLSIKLPGMDLSRVFDALVPYSGWIVKPSVVLAVAIGAIFALLLVAFNISEFQQKLPLANEFFAVRNIFYLMLVLGLTKVLHEFGHALVCRHLGAECHQVGLMFLVFTPCLYCDVSDAWMINGKWRRIFVSSAGMLAEIGLASICTILWWVSEPGLLNSLCLNVMFVCSLGTVLFNGNPLLRYDGYYILSDLTDTPNLWTKSRNTLRGLGDRVLFGLPMAPLESTSWRRYCFLVVFAVSSIAYRLVVVTVILLFIMTVLKSFHLFQLSLFFAAFVLLGAFVNPVVNESKRALVMVKQKKITPFRLAVVWLGLGIGLYLVFALPFPYRVTVPAYIELKNCERVYVTTPGELKEVVVPGTLVQPNQLIATLENPELQVEISIVRGQLEQAKSRLNSLDALRSVDPDYGSRIPTERENVETLKNRLARLQLRIDDLQLLSPVGGTVFAPRDRAQSEVNPHELEAWDGNPMEPKNQAAFLEKGTLLCLVGDPALSRGFALVQQSIVDLIEPGQSVTIQAGNSPERRMTGEIIQLDPLEDIELPPDLRNLIATRFGRDLQINQIEFGTMYLATIHLEQANFRKLNFESAKARVDVSSKSLGFRIGRYLKRTFIFLSD